MSQIKTLSFQPKMILIDVDGTLVDSVPDLAFCVDEMMARINLPIPGEPKARTWVGNGVERLVKRALTNDLEAEPETELLAQALPIFMELYAANTCRLSQLYPGVQEGLDFLQSTAIKLGCVTNKAKQFTIPLLQTLGIADRFEIIISGDTLAKKKPDPLPLLHAASHFNINPDQALMLGDSVSDIKAARAADFNIICVSYGYNHGNDIRDSNPDVVIDSFTELPQYLK